MTQKTENPGGEAGALDYLAWRLFANENGALSDKEHDFLENMRSRLTRRAPTDKQAKWLGDILERCGGYWA